MNYGYTSYGYADVRMPLVFLLLQLLDYKFHSNGIEDRAWKVMEDGSIMFFVFNDDGSIVFNKIHKDI
jgi:hypothetical protein